MAMEASTIPRRAPPARRGKIKAIIFRGLVKAVVSTLAAKSPGEEAPVAAGSGSVSPVPNSGKLSDGNPDA